MITLNTIVYEGNFRDVLSVGGWFLDFKTKYITKKMITVNNINSKDEFKEIIDRITKFIDLDVVYVDDFKTQMINKYKLYINESNIGYIYTIPYFVTIDNIKTEFILNVASDCMGDIRISDEFLEKAIIELRTNLLCSTTMVAWTKNNYIMKNNRKIGEHEEIETLKILDRQINQSDRFNYSAGFTDQFFMGVVEKLKKIDYNISESHSNIIYHGPSYGGNSFEKRMVAHQIYNNTYNCIYKGDDYYIHDKNYY